MKIKGIEHIGIAVESLAKDSLFWKHILNLEQKGTETIASEGVITDIYETGRGKIELLEAIGKDSTIARYLEKRGAGVHHVCFEVEDIQLSIEELIDKGIDVIYKKPKVGAEGFLVTFIHPKSTGGVLVELAQQKI